MKSEVLKEQVEWEVRRVAMAFGVAEWEVNPPLENSNWNFTGVGHEQLIIGWSIKSLDARWFSIEVRSKEVDVANQHW